MGGDQVKYSMVIGNFKFPSKICPSCIVAVLIVLSLLCGCHRQPDSRLVRADAVMEEHPDSAMMILAAYELPGNAPDYDRALYGLLLTQSRYKNFIDETEDSLISASADYFLRHADAEHAARALYLQGMVRLNADRLGEAAVSFTQGLDIARESNLYMWEGQCARALGIIYGRLKNGSQQIVCAEISKEAFSNAGLKDWADYAALNLFRAYQNNGQHEKALCGANDLLETAREEKDTLLMAEVLALMGTCRYSIGEYREAISDYYSAHTLDPRVIGDHESYNAKVASSHIEFDSLPDEIRQFIDSMNVGGLPPFKELASQRRFEEAYYALENYKNEQDSVISVIMQSGVAESLGRYDAMRRRMQSERLRSERLLWIFSILSLVCLIGCSVLYYRHKVYRMRLQRDHNETLLEIMRADMKALLVRNSETEARSRNLAERNEVMSLHLREALYERYGRINALCDSYYEDRHVKSKAKQAEAALAQIRGDFSDPEFLLEVGRYIDRCLDGLYSAFVEDYPDLKDQSRHLFMFSTLGFSNRTLCTVFDIELSNLYNRKSRLRKLVADSGATRREEYMDILA